MGLHSEDDCGLADAADAPGEPGVVIAQAILRRPAALVAVLCLAEVLAMAGFAAYWSLLPVLQPAWA